MTKGGVGGEGSTDEVGALLPAPEDDAQAALEGFDVRAALEGVDLRAAVEEADLEAGLDALAARCAESGIPFDRQEAEEDFGPYVSFTLPAGRGSRGVVVSRPEAVKELLAAPFERQKFLGDYLARCDYVNDEIEAAVEPLDVAGTMRVVRGVFGVELGAPDVTLPSMTVASRDDGSGVTLTLGPISPLLRTLSRRLVISRQFSLTITGAKARQHDQALRVLERLATAFFFQVDVQKGVALTLVRDPERRGRPARRRRQGEALAFPKYQYDPQPMALYWYGRSASRLPLLQFLAYYQAIEYYFPAYSRAEATRRVRNLLKNPAFNPNRDSDIAGVLSAVRAGAGNSFGDERSQLRATIHECLDPNQLTEFIESDAQRLDFLTSKEKLVSGVRLLAASSDIRQLVADRIYDIRCRIVHTKAAAGDQDVELLLPFSREADSLGHDIELIHYVAQQVLVAASTALSV